MKKILLTFLLATTVLYMGAQERKTQSRNVGSFNEIHAGKGINVVLVEGDKEKVVVEIENGEVTDVISELKGRKLNIKFKTKIYNNVAVKVFVTYKSIKAITTGSGAFVESDGIIRAENLDLRAGTGSTIILEVDTKAVSSSLSSSKIELAGKTDFQDVTSNTGAKYIADQLVSKDAFVKTATGGTAWVTATDKLEAKTSTGGKVIYTGNPKKLIQKGNVHRDN
ncbi:DUF2807 domain-containing protein [Labilibacter sediminis]|nr:DUF2807 domain-containing protein [Labilibacter sediminis]